MKIVFPSAEVCHLYAANSPLQQNARNAQGNYSFAAGVFFSYSTAMAYRLPACYGERTSYLMDRGSYSVTTSKLQGRLAWALNHARTLDVAGSLKNYDSIPRIGCGDMVDAELDAMREFIIKAAAPRIRPATRAAHIASAQDRAHVARELASVDAKRKDIAKEYRAKARKQIAQIPNNWPTDCMSDGVDTYINFAKSAARAEAIKERDRWLTLARQDTDMLQNLDLSRFNDAESIYRKAQQTILRFEKAAAAAKLAGLKAIPAADRKAWKALELRMPELEKTAHDAMAASLVNTAEHYVSTLPTNFAGTDGERFRIAGIFEKVKTANRWTTPEKREAWSVALNDATLAHLKARAIIAPDKVAELIAESEVCARNTFGERDGLRYLRDAAAWAADAGERREELTALIAKERESLSAKIEARDAERITEWRAGNGQVYASFGAVTMLRIKGDTIETSRGATVPLSVAPMLWRLIREPITARKFDGEGMRVGHYRLNEVMSDGSLRIGCHLLERAELVQLAITLGYIASEDQA